MILASHYRADHVAQIKPYHSLNKAASSWNTALFEELRKLPMELHIVQFYPVLKTHVIKEGNATYYYLPRIPKIDSFTSLAKKWRIYRLALKIRPDVIHGIGSEHGHAWAAIHKCWPSVITIHGYLKNINRLAGHQSLLKAWFLEREEQKALLQATTVIAINGYMKELFMQAGCAENNIRIVHNPLGPLYHAPCNNIERDIDILMVGTLHPLKNVHIALQIFSYIQSEHGFNASITIAGAPTTVSGNYYQELLAFKEKHGLSNVKFVGSVDQQRLKELYCNSKMLLHISEFETDSMVISEAMACGVLTVVNPVAAMGYRVMDGINGYHVNIRDTRQAASRLVTILKDHSRTSEMARLGRNQAIQERDPVNVAQETLDAYRATLNRIRSVQGDFPIIL